ncbi:hypothetical protein [Novosphingobium sp.]|uniref:hypothetical protein n=1 Tax=Novosphingobium sp. TaxID=1874826 RepID=UPI002FE3CDDC
MNNLTKALLEGDEINRLNAEEIIRSRIDQIVVTPEGQELVVEVHGDLVGILTIASDRAKRTKKAGSKHKAEECQLGLVAGAGFGRSQHSLTAVI